MNEVLSYLLKSTVFLSVFLSFFLLVMRRSEYFRFNRYSLLGGSMLCLLLPLIRFHVSRPTLYSEWLQPVVVVTYGEDAASEVAAAASGLTISWQAVALALYLAGAFVMLGFYLYSYGRLIRLIRHTPAERRDGFTLHLVPYETPSFSWMRHIVMNRDDYARHPVILLHEQAHVRCGHSRDLLLSSALTVLQWFNPLVWIGRSELKLLHEYEADDFVLNQGIDATQYQLLLVKKAVGEKRFLLANGFNHAQLKNRITMMQTTSRAVWKKFFLLLLIPLFAGTLLLLAECQTAVKEEVPAESADAVETATEIQGYAVTVTDASEAEGGDDVAIPFKLVEVKPKFQDGDANAFSLWVNKNLKYPAEAKEKKLQGRVTLQFTVEKDGSVTGVKVLRGVDPILDGEAVRVISQSPKWSPGYTNGEPVRVTYNFPVVYQLK
ncbi:MAG: M56 family metallopeptidase [Bacteroidales bacterium]|nr:M56 family metallopeptidase [Bacteroidales bacterium]